MNKLSMSVSYSDKSSVANRLMMIKQVGFDACMLNWYGKDFVVQDACEQVRVCDEINLDISCVHLDFNNINDLYVSDNNKTVVDIANWLKLCGNNGIDKAIFHLSSGFDAPKFNEVGVNNVKRLLEVCEKYEIKLCLENLRQTSYIDELLKCVSSQCLAMCYDCGHEQLYNPTEDVVVKFADRLPLLTTHLHDNRKNIDDHMLIGDGDIDMNKVIRQLVAVDYKEHLILEPLFNQTPLLYGDYNEMELAQKSYDRLFMFRKQLIVARSLIAK